MLAKRAMGIELAVSSTHMLEVFCGALGQMAAARSLLVTSLFLRSLTSVKNTSAMLGAAADDERHNFVGNEESLSTASARNKGCSRN